MANVTTGQETLAYCTSCKMDLNHVIVAMKGDQIVRVQCKTCKKEHNFKAPKGATEPGKAKAKKSKKAASDEPKVDHSIEAEWEKLMSQHRDAPFRAYTTKTHFLLGDKVKHPTFGDGIVGKHIYPNKIEVIFRTDVKILIHAGTPSH